MLPSGAQNDARCRRTRFRIVASVLERFNFSGRKNDKNTVKSRFRKRRPVNKVSVREWASIATRCIVLRRIASSARHSIRGDLDCDASGFQSAAPHGRDRWSHSAVNLNASSQNAFNFGELIYGDLVWYAFAFSVSIWNAVSCCVWRFTALVVVMCKIATLWSRLRWVKSLLIKEGWFTVIRFEIYGVRIWSIVKDCDSRFTTLVIVICEITTL